MLPQINTCKAAAGTGSRTVADFFTGSKDLSVTRAETLFTEHIIEYKLPLACADHAGQIFRKMFPDSTIASKYGSGRTKTGFICEALARSDSVS